MWPIEKISDYHCVYIRVFRSLIDEGLPSKSAFSNTPKDGDNLSSDWCKYCSPQTSRELIGLQKDKQGNNKNFEDFYIWQFSVIALRELDIPQQVEHEPFYNNPEKDGEPNNRAHSIIIGNKLNKAEFKVKMQRAGKWAISP
jgi:hypothetical protein